MPEYTFSCKDCSEQTVIFCNISEYQNQINTVVCEHCNSKKVFRDLSGDNITGFTSVSMSDCKTVGHYAEKQSAKYGKQKVEDMLQSFKTQKEGGMSELPEGMSRVEKPKTSTQWTKQVKKKRPVKKKKRG